MAPSAGTQWAASRHVAASVVREVEESNPAYSRVEPIRTWPEARGRNVNAAGARRRVRGFERRRPLAGRGPGKGLGPVQPIKA